MIDYLRGKLAAAAPGRVVLEVGGVALQVAVPLSSPWLQGAPGTEITVYTRLHLKEEEIVLYGFSEPMERSLFNLIIGVAGFGPRLALALLSVFSPSELYLAVLEENISSLCRAPGVGRKVAQRLVLELKEKLPELMAPEEAAAVPAGSGAAAEVVDALCALGYSRGEAFAAVNRVDPDRKAGLSREDLLKAALKNMTGPMR